MSNNTKIKNPMKVVTGRDTRWSYVNAWEAKSINGGKPKFSVSLVIPKSDTKTVEKINAAAPDFLMVCLGAPKQELWMHRNAPALNVGLMIGAGGSLDVFAGVAERAPEKWQRANLEWLYRFFKEPKRMWKRVFVSNPRFLALTWKEMLSGR